MLPKRTVQYFTPVHCMLGNRSGDLNNVACPSPFQPGWGARKDGACHGLTPDVRLLVTGGEFERHSYQTSKNVKYTGLSSTTRSRVG